MNMTPTGRIARVLTVAGSDSGGGAGIQADLKTLAAHGVYGACAVTALTVQDTRGVQEVAYAGAQLVAAQMRAVLSDIGADVVKTGMLGAAGTVYAVSAVLRENGMPPLVMDPVMAASKGGLLLDPDAIEVVMGELVPLSSIVMPNLEEAAHLCGYPVVTREDGERAAADFLAAGAGAVLLKGGHGTAGWADERLSVDLLFEGRTVTALAAPRIATRNTHGTGCTYASAIAACLALGMPLLASVGCARAFVQQAVERATDWHMGEGDGPLDHSAPALNRACGALQAGESYLWDGGAWRQL